MVDSAAKGLGFEIRFHTVGPSQSIDTLFEEIIAGRAQALSAGGGRVYEARQRIAELALQHRLASAFISRPSVEAGGLLSYSPAASEEALTANRMADYVDRILRGAKPADLPVELPSRYELVLNLTTAKVLGLTVPPSLLARADAIIQ